MNEPKVRVVLEVLCRSSAEGLARVFSRAEFAGNNKAHTATKVLPFMVNYGREMRMEGNIRKKGKVEKAGEFVERIKRIHEEAGAALKKVQEDMKR